MKGSGQGGVLINRRHGKLGGPAMCPDASPCTLTSNLLGPHGLLRHVRLIPFSLNPRAKKPPPA